HDVAVFDLVVLKDEPIVDVAIHEAQFWWILHRLFAFGLTILFQHYVAMESQHDLGCHRPVETGIGLFFARRALSDAIAHVGLHFGDNAILEGELSGLPNIETTCLRLELTRSAHVSFYRFNSGAKSDRSKSL